ncbi:MAG: MFS transporter [Oscillospiraceae bacterium]|nr:MFS transporter [Oscillospiraceae bacterium]
MEKEKTTLKAKEILGYGIGGMFPYGFVLCVTGYYLLIFMTDIAGFPTALAAGLYTAIQIIKLITMAVSGVIVDKVNFKGGKYCTWILIAGIGLGISFPLCFLYLALPTTAYAALFMVVYTIQTLCYNVGWTAQRAIIGPMSKNNADVVTLNTAAQFSGLFTSVVYGIVGNAVLGIALWKNTKQLYAGASAVYGVVIILGSILLYSMCKKYEAGETKAAEKQKSIGFGEMLKSFKGPAIPFFFSYTFTAATTGFFQALLAYYTTYVLNDPKATAIALSATAIFGVLGCVLTPMMSKKMTKKGIHITSQLVSAVGYVALALFGKTAAVFIIIRAIITFVGMPSTIVMNALANDIGDKIEMEGGTAPRAFLQSLAGTSNRAGLVISSAIASFSLAAIGYHEGVTFTPAMTRSLVMLIAAVPGIACLLAAVCMFFYHVDEKELAAYHASKNTEAVN